MLSKEYIEHCAIESDIPANSVMVEEGVEDKYEGASQLLLNNQQTAEAIFNAIAHA